MKTFILVLVPLIALGCGEEKGHDHEDEGHEEHAHDEHAHEAKHGGDLITLGDHEGFLEVKLDHDAGKLTVWVYLGEEMKSASLDRAPVLNFKTDSGPKQLTGEASGGKWIFTSDALRGEPEGARFRIVMGGKSYSPEWDHHHGGGDGHEGHDHD